MSIKKRRKYTDEFKRDAVMLVTAKGYKVSEAARNLGINEGTLRRWIKNSADTAETNLPSSGELTKEQVRIRELEAQVKRLEMEREILKKANSRFNGRLQHSDRGSQYASYDYQDELKKYGMVCSMSGKGDCWDNAVVERFFRSLKTEQTDHCLYQTREAAKQDVIDYIEMFYNSHRLHSYLGYQSPNAYETMAVPKVA